MKHVAKLSIIYAVSIMMVGLLVFQIFPDKLLAMFNASEHMLTIGVPALRIISLSFMFAGFCIVIGSGQRCLQSGGICGKTAFSAASRSLSAFPDR